MFRYDRIEHVHVELTTRCNALCPMCRRTAFGSVAPGLAQIDLRLADIRAIFTSDFLQQLRQVDLCGVHGDPVAATSLDDVLQWFAEINPALAIEVYTHGAIRPTSWWAELGRSYKTIKVVFAIDGLEDTHTIYRRGTRFAKAVENARAFIGAGGRAQWDFLVFRHNEHQVEEAKRRAQAWGFEAFVPKYSGRFNRGYYENDPKLRPDERWDRFPIYNKARQVVGYLEPPSNPQYINPTYERMAAHFARDGSLIPHWDKTEICCKVIENRSIFVAADGTVFPCCWTYGTSLYRTVYGIDDLLDNQVEDLLQRHGGRAAIDGRRRPIRDICESEVFREIAQSWQLESLAAGKLKICARMCGGDFSPFRNQFSDRRFEPGIRPQDRYLAVLINHFGPVVDWSRRIVANDNSPPLMIRAFGPHCY
jgi:MoaA/NifB/PqqE/SkfB family radical SAM enzyme